MRGLRSPSPQARARAVTVRAGTSGNERVRLSVYDLLAGTIYTPRTFFYRATLDAGALRASLARTLRHYPVLTGRLARDRDGGLSVLCNDGGVLFTETSSDQPMPDYGIGRSAKPDLRRYIREVNPLRVVGRDVPLFTVKVTHMRGGGSVLGLAANHSIVDGGSYLAFLRHWSSEHRGLAHPLPCHDRSLLDALGEKAAPGAREHSSQYTLIRRRDKFAFFVRILAHTARVTTLTLGFPPDEIRAIKAVAMTGLAGTGQWVSTNDALIAHLWQVLAELRNRPGTVPETLGLITGIRSALGSALPEHYWGNAVTNASPVMPAAELRSASLGSVAQAVRGGLASLTEQSVCDEIGFLTAQREAGRSRQVLSRMWLDAFTGTVAFNNVAQLPVYEIEFGSGKPFWYEYPATPIPWTVHITQSPAQDGGRVVDISLPRGQADALGQPHWQERLHAHAPACPL